jgi:hypothetical protein
MGFGLAALIITAVPAGAQGGGGQRAGATKSAVPGASAGASAGASEEADEQIAHQAARPTARWQLMFADGTYLWELQLVRLSGDTLIVAQGDTLRAVPLAVLDELRQVGKSIKMVGAGARGVFGGLAGADDEVYKLTLDSVAEKRRIVEALLRRTAAAADNDVGRTP